MCGQDTLAVGHLDSQRSLPAIRPAQTGLSPMARKLRLLLDNTVLVLNAPEGFLAQLQPGPKTLATALRPNETYDVVLLFVNNTDDLRKLGPGAIGAAKPNGLLWITYPKGGPARGHTDLPATPWWVRHDVLGEVTSVTGYKPVAFVALDDSWTALRFKRT
jgi:hypothetical protein